MATGRSSLLGSRKQIGQQQENRGYELVKKKNIRVPLRSSRIVSDFWGSVWFRLGYKYLHLHEPMRKCLESRIHTVSPLSWAMECYYYPGLLPYSLQLYIRAPWCCCSCLFPPQYIIVVVVYSSVPTLWRVLYHHHYFLCVCICSRCESPWKTSRDDGHETDRAQKK